MSERQVHLLLRRVNPGCYYWRADFEWWVVEIRISGSERTWTGEAKISDRDPHGWVRQQLQYTKTWSRLTKVRDHLSEILPSLVRPLDRVLARELQKEIGRRRL